MNRELEEKLVKKYPKLFRNYRGDPRQTCMAWGMTCGDGWYNLIDELCSKLEPFGLTAAQVKEKFGGLRFYIEGCPSDKFEEIYKYIGEAEKKSVETCEVCGKPGEVRGGSWLRCLCDDHHKTREKNKQTINCPKCDSEHTYYSLIDGVRICQECRHEF